MTHQEYVIYATKLAGSEFFRYANAVANDQIEFVVAPGTRSVLSICREIAMTPGWGEDLLFDKPQDWSPEAMQKVEEEQKQWTSIEQCEAEFNRRLSRFFEAVESFPDSQLMDTKFLPFEGGRDFTFVEIMDYPKWNLNYHTGQVALIQLALGDPEMY